jgi:hypothetical protein
MNRRIVIATLAAAALAVPAAAGAQPGSGKGHDKPASKAHGKAKKVTFVFRGTFTGPGTVEVLAGNAHVRKGGFVGEAVTFDFASAKVVVADTNADQTFDIADVKDGDSVLVQARHDQPRQGDDHRHAQDERAQSQRPGRHGRAEHGEQQGDDGVGRRPGDKRELVPGWAGGHAACPATLGARRKGALELLPSGLELGHMGIHDGPRLVRVRAR